MNRSYCDRKIDRLGRICIPAEVRRALDLNPEDTIRFVIGSDRLILEKQEPSCCFCGAKRNLKEYRSHFVCIQCLNQLKGEMEDED